MLALIEKQKQAPRLGAGSVSDMSFDLLGLGDKTLKAVNDAGYTEPTPIQKQAIPVVLTGRDVLGIAQTGTGKTAGFTLPMIDILASGRARARMPRSLILEPTRELAAQVSENFEIYGKYHKLTMALLIGGVSFADQNKKLDRGVDVLIATPGRLLDHFERGRLMLNGVQILVVDEADRMLDMGFIPDVEKICKLMPQRHQTLFFSATMPPEVKRLTDTFLDDPKQIAVAPPATASATVTQHLVHVSQADKRKALRALIASEEVKNAIIFCNRKRDVDTLFRSLKKHGFNAAALHGDLAQSYRMEVLGKFRSGEISLLIASDVAARGLDIPDVSHIFNFDVPSHAEDYIHRIGRTGRAGRSGRAFTFVTPMDRKYLKAITNLLGADITPIEVPGLTAAQSDDARPDTAKDSDSRPKRSARAPAKKSPPTRQNRSEQQRSEPKRPEQKRSGRRESGASTPVVGLGDHVPDFLTRPMPTRPRQKTTTEPEPEQNDASQPDS